MSDIDGNLAPPGTRIAPRRNLKPVERGLSVAAGSVIGVIATQQKGTAGVLMGLLGSLLVARGVTGASPAKRLIGQRPDEAEIAKAAGWSSAALVSRAVTINAPREMVYRQFREIQRWPYWAFNVESVRIRRDGRLHFVSIDPTGPVEWDARITDERPGELLAIASVPGSKVPTTARYEFRDAVGGRGTEIHAAVAYRPPGGSMGRYAAKLTQREPGIQLRRDLKRFKSLIETGEIATNSPQGTVPKA
ncbi:cyclase [Polymorphobacter glacialis]|uniref:Cyclase n=1 Tax=Sandarakinorhabdus glacialis TaxID=1614636 RepID=A0A916ZVV9_9SPHN|nr:SRPBCC family protein [Polymorphobacter glacialis]GGE16409.1 cyclase [Polymorphobacter glacialis]